MGTFHHEDSRLGPGTTKYKLHYPSSYSVCFLDYPRKIPPRQVNVHHNLIEYPQQRRPPFVHWPEEQEPYLKQNPGKIDRC